MQAFFNCYPTKLLERHDRQNSFKRKDNIKKAGRNLEMYCKSSRVKHPANERLGAPVSPILKSLFPFCVCLAIFAVDNRKVIQNCIFLKKTAGVVFGRVRFSFSGIVDSVVRCLIKIESTSKRSFSWNL